MYVDTYTLNTLLGVRLTQEDWNKLTLNKKVRTYCTRETRYVNIEKVNAREFFVMATV